MSEQAPRVVVRAARPDELAALLEAIVAAFGERARDRMSAQLYEDSGHRLHQSRVAEIDGEVASYVRVSARPLHYGAAVLPMGAIGAVSSRPQYQGRGLASAVLSDAITYMRGEGYVMSMLFTGIQGFYGRLGWVPFPEPTCRVPLPAREAASAQATDAYGVRPFVEQTDLAAVEEIYDRYNARRTGPVVRDAAYWRDGHTRYLGILPAFICEQSATGVVVAYASWRSPREGHLDVYEAGCLPGHEQAFGPLAGAVVAAAGAAGAQEIALRLGASHGLTAAVRRAAGTVAETLFHEHMMLLVLDLPGLLRAALPALHERLAARPWLHDLQARWDLRVAGQQAGLAVARGQVTVGGGESGRPLALEEGLFWRLFLGASAVHGLTEELATTADIVLSPAEAALLDALFPPQDPHYWWPDHF